MKNFAVILSFLSLLSISFSAPPDLLFSFEEIGDTVAVDSGGSGIEVPLHPGSLISDDEAKFGAGALLIGGASDARLGRGWYVYQKAELAGLNDEIQKLTILGWVRMADTKLSVVVLRRGQVSPANWLNFMYASSCLQFSIQLEDLIFQVTSAPIFGLMEGEWRHFAVTFDEGEVTFYLDGEPWGEPKIVEISTIPATKESSASFAGFLDSPNGTLVDDFAFLGNRALTALEIAEIYSEGLEAFSGRSADVQ